MLARARQARLEAEVKRKSAELANAAKIQKLTRKVAELDLGNKKMSLEIKKVDTTGVEGRHRVGTGFIVISVTYPELSVKERYARLGKEQDPETDLMRALLLIEARRPDLVPQMLERAGTPLALAMKESVEGAIEKTANLQLTVKAELDGKPVAAFVAFDGERQNKTTPSVFSMETGKTYRVTVSLQAVGTRRFTTWETEYSADRPVQETILARP